MARTKATNAKEATVSTRKTLSAIVARKSADPPMAASTAQRKGAPKSGGVAKRSGGPKAGTKSKKKASDTDATSKC
jgi:hypothetical protein